MKKSVAAYCAERILFNVKSLEEEEAFDLFKNKVYRNERTEVIENGKHIVDSYFREITAKCGGLPSVIIAVADILKLIVVTSEGKNLERLEIQCMKLRGKFFDEIKKKTAALRNLFTWVDSYFLNCRDFLKPCIFYLSIFPPSHMIRRRRLVRRWTAEGYSRANKELTAEEMSEEVMSNLIELSMIHPLEVTASMASFGVRMPLCQVNGFFREYIVSVSKEEKLVFELKGHCKMNLERTGQHLAIQRDWDRDRNVFDGSIDVSRLRSLTVLGEWRPFFVSDKMRVLRVLDLEGTLGVKDKELEEMLQLLPPLLRFLSLRGCRDITRLPDYLGRLRQLQTLDVRNTSVVALPSSITKLHKLDYARGGPKVSCNIDMGAFEILPPLAPSSRQCTPSVYCLLSKARQCTSSMYCLLPKDFGHQPPHAYIAGGVEVPRGIGKLSALHTLGVVHINSGAAGEVILEDLKNLTQLHKLGVCGVNQGNNQKLFSAISCHAHLQSLSVHLDENNQAGSLDDVSISEHLVNLRSLKLYGLVGNSPKWIKRLMNLRKLKLQTDAKLPQGDIDVLGTLPRLQILCLWLKEFQYGKLQFGAGFSELFVLEITCNSSSTDVSFQGESTMQSLEVIKIRCCSVSHLQFTGLLDLLELAEVRLSGTYDCAFKQTLLSQLADHSEMPPVLKEWNADLKEWKTVDPEGH
ncbi:hypothetical protein BS78_09G049000 [Paspalum vaginatum]|nr:hypothetical protein BS78_09G049000 [Paspalum vaginatum]